MSEYRRDPLSNHWVIMAPERELRPRKGSWDERVGGCPFCPGHEAETPPQAAAYSVDGQLISQGRWQVRVVPNKYPAVCDIPPDPLSNDAFFQTRQGVGVHEVIVDCPDHGTSLRQLPTRHAALIFQAYRDRLVHWREDPRLAYGQIFKNSGPGAGASLEHPHSQLIATPVVPTQVSSELSRSRRFFRRQGSCVFCGMLERELAAGVRVVAQTDQFVVICPFASQFAYETWILPKRHGSHFEFAQDGQIEGLAMLVQDVLRRLECLLNDPEFNYLIHTAPFRVRQLPYYHWHVEIFPRLAQTAGFEWGAGDYINSVAPEQAAEQLRHAWPTGSPPAAVPKPTG